MKKVNLYTDGACRGNPGPGGYGVILEYNGHRKTLSGGEASTTNNRMELTAAIVGMEALKEDCEITLCSDSKYLIDAIEKGWLESWYKRGWIKADKKPVLNPDLWQKVYELIHRHKVTTVWIKGHDGHPENEECDRMATAEADKFKV